MAERLGGSRMAWEIAAYAIAAAVIMIGIAVAAGIAKTIVSLRRIDASLERVSKTAVETLEECRQLSEEAREALQASRQRLQGFASLAEGARAIGEAAQAAAQSAVRVTEMYRDCLISPLQASSCDHGEGDGSPDIKEFGRKLWSLWKHRTSPGSRDEGPSADPSEGV